MSLVYHDFRHFKRVIPKNDAVIPEIRPIMKFNMRVSFPAVISRRKLGFCDKGSASKCEFFAW
jgi:hypothetical protein